MFTTEQEKWYLGEIKKAKAWLSQGDDRTVAFSWDPYYAKNAKEFHEWLRFTLHRRINEKAGGDPRPDRLVAYECDRRIIHGYLHHRERRRGSQILRTRLAKKYPHINNQPWRLEDL